MHAICLASGGVRGKGGVDGIRYIHHGGSLSLSSVAHNKVRRRGKKMGENKSEFQISSSLSPSSPTPQSHVT